MERVATSRHPKTAKARKEVLDQRLKRLARTEQLVCELLSDQTIIRRIQDEFGCGHAIVSEDIKRFRDEQRWVNREHREELRARFANAFIKGFRDSMTAGNQNAALGFLKEGALVLGLRVEEGLNGATINIDASIIGIVNEIRALAPGEREARIRELDAIDIEPNPIPA